MQFLSEIALFILAALVGGIALGVLAHRTLTGKYSRIKEVRWHRRINDNAAAHQKEIETLGKALSLAKEKEGALTKALAESDETVHLLSADRRAGYEKDVAERNMQIAELSSKLSHARAKAADAIDEESVLGKKIAVLKIALQQRENQLTERDSEIEKLRALGNQQAIEEKMRERDEHIVALKKQMESLHAQLPGLNDALCEHKLTVKDLQNSLAVERRKTESLEKSIADSQVIAQDAVKEQPTADNAIRKRQSQYAGPGPGPWEPVADAAESEQRVRALENELRAWKNKYESARGNQNHISDSHGIAARQHPDGDQSELRQIRGIGPAVENRLNEAGIFHVKQLAGIDATTMDRLATQDQSLPGCIRRYRLVEQARAMQESRSPSEPRPNA